MRHNDKLYYAAEALYKIASGMPSLWSSLDRPQIQYWMRQAEPMAMLADAIVADMPDDDVLEQELA